MGDRAVLFRMYEYKPMRLRRDGPKVRADGPARLWQDGVVMIRAVLLVALLVGLPGAAAAQSQPALRAYAILGVNEVRVGANVRVQPGAVGATAGSVRLATAAQVPGTVVGDSVRVARRVRVGRLFCGLVSGAGFGPGVVGGPTVGGSPIPGCLKLTPPVVDPTLLVPVTVAPGTTDMVVGPRSSAAPLAPGAYGALRVGRGSLLQLDGGAYQVRSIRLAPTARLVCVDDCRIGVAENVRLGPKAQLGAVKGLMAERVRFDIAAGTTGAAFRAGPHTVVAGTVFAPTGTVLLGPNGDYQGAFVGSTVVVRTRSQVHEQSAFPPPPRG